jgi:dihydrofolate reductase
MPSRKCILYIACSLDGYIAAPGDNLDFLDKPEHGDNDYGYAEFTAGVDTMILGRKTFDWVLSKLPDWPHKEYTYVWTRTPKAAHDNVEYFSGELADLIHRLKNEKGKNIFINGGSEVVHELLKRGLIDEIIISYMPVLLGEGTPLFRSGRPEQWLELVSAKTYSSGVLQVHYRQYTAA